MLYFLHVARLPEADVISGHSRVLRRSMWWWQVGYQADLSVR